MNIGEISKSTADRAQLKKTVNARSTVPVAPSEKVSDLVELSEESRHKYEDELAKELVSDKNQQLDDQGPDDASRDNISIDLEV